MSKFLRTAALVVGGIALAATGVGAALDAGIFGAGLSVAAGSAIAGEVATGAAIASAGLGVVAQLTAKKPKPIGNPMQWQSDPQAGIPIVIGRAYSGGKIIYRQGWGKNNKWETIHTVHSIGPVQSFEQLYVDGVATSVSADTTVNIASRGYMFERHQIGAQPESAALQVGQGGYPPGIGVTSKLSGLASSAIQLVYDTKGKTTLTTEPQCGYVVQGVRVYDPRKDSTYPGGSGPQRVNDETTWSYTGKDNPYLAALAWVIGWRQNGKLVAGVGAPVSLILLDQFVEGANVADANGWKCGGILDTTDDKWQRLKDILLAGGGEPMRLGAQLGCLINTPRVSLATIGVNDVIGDASVQATQSMRDRINAVVPRFMAESSIITSDSSGNLVTTVTWGMAAAGPVIVSDYVTFDGRQRQTQIDFEFVQGPGGGATAPNQVAQLARYAIENAREFGPITLPLKLRWMGYKPGDVVTATLPELGLNGQDILLLNRSLDPAKGAVTMTARSETYAKHAFALGQTTTAPATPSVSGPPLIPTPDAADWSIIATFYSSNNQVVPALVVSGQPDVVADGVVFEYRVCTGTQGTDDDWQTAGTEPLQVSVKPITGLIGGIPYQVSIRYRSGPGVGDRLILGPATPALPVGTGGPGSYTILNRENMSIVGSTVSKTGGANNWGDASVVSAESYVGGASCSFQPAQTNAEFMIGLNSDPGTDDTYTSLDFAVHIRSDGQWDVFESNTAPAGPWPYAAGDTFQVVYNNATVSYVQNGTVRYSHAVGPNLQLWLDSAFATVGAKVTNLTFAGTGAKGADGVDGHDGAPGETGPAGATLYTWIAYADSADGTVNFTTGAPGGRGYQGIAVNQTTATEGTNPASYQWGLYRGPASFGLVPSNANITVGPDYIVCTAASIGWDESAYSDTGWQGGAQLAWTCAQLPPAGGSFMMALNADPTTDRSYTSLDYAINCQDNGSWTIYEGGTYVGVTGTLAAGDRFQIRYDNKLVTYFRNGAVIRTVAAASGLTLYLDSSFNPGGRADKIAFGAAGAAGSDGSGTVTMIPVGAVTKTPDGLNCPSAAGNGTTNGAYSAQVFAGGVNLSFKRPNSYGTEDAFFGINSDPSPSIDYPNIDYALRHYLNGSSYLVEAWESGVGIALEGWNGAFTYQIRYDGQNVIYSRYDPSTGATTILRTVAAGANRSFGVSMSALGKASITSMSFTAAGQKGADGVSPVLVSTATSLVISCDSGGTPKASQLPASLKVTIMQGGVDVTSSASVAVTASSGVTASYSPGVLTISGVANGGTVTLVATSGSVTGRSTTTITTSLDAPPSAQVSGAWNGSISTSYPAIGQIGVLTLPATSTGIINVSWLLTYNTNAGGGASANEIAKAQYRAQGSSTWIDVPGSEVTGYPAFGANTATHEPASAGSNHGSFNLSGLSSGQNYEFQLLAYRNGTGTMSTSGSMLLANH